MQPDKESTATRINAGVLLYFPGNPCTVPAVAKDKPTQLKESLFQVPHTSQMLQTPHTPQPEGTDRPIPPPS